MSYRPKLKIIIVSLLLLFPSSVFGATYYLSPVGNDSNTISQAQSEITPWKSFTKAFSSMNAGDELILLDGVYSESAGTGTIHYSGTYSAQPPSGSSKANPTIVRAKNKGSVEINGELFVGRSNRKDSFLKIEGITFNGGGKLYNTSYVYLKDCGFANGFLGVGTNDHDNGNTYNLIEDCWVFAENSRGIAMNYRADYNIWRRVVIRGDGCNTLECAGSGNPNIGFTVYNSKFCSIQNVIIVDRILNGGSAYGDFATAQHNSNTQETPLQGNEWLGCISLNSEDTGFHMEADNAISPSHYLKNCIAMSSNSITAGFNFNYTRGVIVENCSTLIKPGSSAIILFTHGDSSTGQVTRNILAKGDCYWAVNRGGTTSYVSSYGDFSRSRYNSTIISAGEFTNDPQADGNPPSLKYPVRIESGSALKGAGYNNEDIGANIVYRYGIDGTFYGDIGYNTLTEIDLWPWPNEETIKGDMSQSSTRGFCANGKQLNGIDDITLTSYIWEYLGNPMPSGMYAESASVTLSASTDSGTAPLVVNFSANASSPNGVITTYEWDFNGDNIYDSNTGGNDLSVATYENAGIYTAKVKVTDSNGLTAIGTRTVTVSSGENVAPTVALAANATSGIIPFAVSFSATASDSDGTIQSYEWDFDGDGTYDQNTGTTSTASYTYTVAGTFVATVRVTDNSNAQTTDNISITAQVAQAVELVTIIPIGGNWKYFKGTSYPGDEWNLISFNDSSWLEGVTGIGYGDGDDATVLSDMSNNYVTVYARKTFSLNDPSTVSEMIFNIDYDDGFIAYINGVEIARGHMPSGIPENNTMASGHEAGTPVSFDVSQFTNVLVQGTNLLSVEVHNSEIASSDFSMIPELLIRLAASQPTTLPPPASLRIIE